MGGPRGMVLVKAVVDRAGAAVETGCSLPSNVPVHRLYLHNGRGCTGSEKGGVRPRWIWSLR